MRTVARHRLGMFPLEHRTHIQAEVGVEVDGGVGVVEIGVAITGEVRRLEGQTIPPVIGSQTPGWVAICQPRLISVLTPLQGAPTPREAPTPYDAAPTPAFSVPTPGYGLGQQTTAPVGVTRIPNTPGYYSAQTPGVFDSLDDGTKIVFEICLGLISFFSRFRTS